MVDFRAAMEGAVRSAFCQMLRANNGLQEYFVRNGFSPARIPLGLGGFLYRLACSREPAPQVGGGIEGGQCQGVNYGFVSVYRYRSAPTEPWVGDTRTVACPSSFFGEISNVREDTIGGGKSLWVDGFDSLGNPLTIEAANFSTANDSFEFESISFTAVRCDGNPDDCGSLPAPSPPSNYNDIDIDVDYNIDVDNQVSIPVNITFQAPRLDITNNINIPVAINFNDPLLNVEVNASANFNISTGDINFNFGGNSGGDDRSPRNPDKTEPIEPPPPPPGDTGDEGDEDPEDPTRVTVIRGALVTISEPDPSASVIFQEDGQPDIYAPNLGFVHFRVRIGSGISAWLADIPIKNKRQYIPCPFDQGAVAVEWTPRGSTQGILTAIRYREDRPNREPVP